MNLKNYETRERLAFMSVLNKFESKLKGNQKMYYYIIDNERGTRFDVIMHIYTNDGAKLASNIIEVKVRDRHFNDLILEEKKYKELKRLAKKEEKFFEKVNIYYLNFTPKSTYLWNLSKMNIMFNKSDKELNKTTFKSTSDKAYKQVAYLDILDASDLNYKYDYTNTASKLLKSKQLEQEATRCIFASVKNLK